MKREWVPLLLIVFALAGLGAGLSARALTEGNGRVKPDTVERILTTSESFPAVVATVNGEPVSGTTLAYNVEIQKINAGQEGAADSGLVAQALDGLIKEELLVQAARRIGLWPSEEEVSAFAREFEQKMKDLQAGSPEREAADRGYALQGFSVDDIDSAAVLLDAHARSIAISRMLTQIEQTVPQAQRSDLDAMTAAVDNNVAQLRSQADIVIYISIP